MNSRPRILMVEDEPVIVAAGKRALQPEGFIVDEAQTVPEALDRLQDQDYDLILCDLMLPQVTGLELVAAVHRDNPALPVILISGYATLDNALKSFRAGAFDFIPKPFDVGELLGVVYRGIAYGSADTPPPRNPDFYSLGRHAWAKDEGDGLWVMGPGYTLSNRMGRIDTVEFPPLESEVLQGNWCAKITSENDHIHKVWAPLSGKVLAVNNALEADASPIDTDPFGGGWLVKILPTNLQHELNVLHSGRRS